MENDEVRDENPIRIRKSRMKRKRFTKRKDLESGGLPCLAPSSDEACKQESNAKSHGHTVFKCLNTSLLAIVAVKYQAISQDPFKTLTLSTWSFLIAIFIYSLILLAMKQSRNHCNKNLQKILGRVSLVSGVVSSVSLVSLLLPHFYSLIVLYISWALFVVISAWPQLQWAYNGLLIRITALPQIQWVHNRLLIRITTVIDFAKNLFNGSNSSQQQSPPQETIPPV